MMDNEEKGGPKEPPRIKLDLADTAKLKSDSAVIKPANGHGHASPPKLKLRLPKDLVEQATKNLSKGDTGKVAPSPTEAEPTTANKPIEAEGKPPVRADQTMRLSLDEEENEADHAPAKAQVAEKPVEDSGRTMRLSLDEDAADEEVAVVAAKEESAEEQEPAEAVPTKELTATQEVKPAPETESAEDVRPKSQPIHLEDINEDSLEDLYKAALNATQRVILEEKEATSRIKPATSDASSLTEPETAELRKNVTAHLNLADISDPKETQSPSETDRLSGKEPPKPQAGTVRLHRPSPPGAQVVPAAPEQASDTKSATARIDLPPSAMGSQSTPTQRKTIRIKRPAPAGGGAGGPRLTVTRAAGEKKAVPAVAGASKKAVKLDSDEFEVHPAFTAVAVVAVLISLAVVYVLAATLVPGIPFPGRLV